MFIGTICAAVLAASPNSSLTKAEELVSSVRYADAEQALAAAWATPNNPRETVIRILELRGIVNAVLGTPKATEYFRRLLTIDPGHKLADGQPPRVRTPFYEAKGQVSEAAEMKLTGSGAVDGAIVKLTAQLTADPMKLARKVRFHVRSGGAEWKNFDVALSGLTAALTAGSGKVEWWLELLGEHDGALLKFASAEQPSVTETAVAAAVAHEPDVVRPAPAPRAEASRSLLLPGIFVGAGVAAAGAGIALGLMSRGSYAQIENAPRDASGTTTTLTQAEAGRLRASGQTQALVANVLFGTAGALAAAGVLTFVLEGPSKVAVTPSPSGLVLAGEFP
jgi:hypothetical protein